MTIKDTRKGNAVPFRTLKKGDVFLIKALNVPDYWWDGTSKSILETTKVPLEEYTKTVIMTDKTTIPIEEIVNIEEVLL